MFMNEVAQTNLPRLFKFSTPVRSDTIALLDRILGFQEDYDPHNEFHSEKKGSQTVALNRLFSTSH